MYKCNDCNRQFLDTKRVNKEELYSEYVFGKQTIKQLSLKYEVSFKTVQRKLNSHKPQRLISRDKSVVILMDTTYWGWSFGVVVFKDAKTKKIIWHKYIRKKETLFDYQEGIDWLTVHGFKIKGIVCDGLRGMFSHFSSYAVQVSISSDQHSQRLSDKGTGVGSIKRVIAYCKDDDAHGQREFYCHVFDVGKQMDSIFERTFL